MRRKADSSFLGNNLRNSLIFRIFYINCILTVLILMGMAGFIISRYSNRLYQTEMTAEREAVDSFFDFVEEKARVVRDIESAIYGNGGIDNTLMVVSRNATYAYTMEASKAISNFQRTCSLRDADMWDFIIVSATGAAFHYSPDGVAHAVLQSFGYLELPAVRELVTGQNESMVYYDKSPAYTVRNAEPVVTYAGKIYNPTLLADGAPIGVFLINYRYETFETYYQKVRLKFRGTMLVYDRNGRVLYSSEAADVGTLVSDGYDLSRENAFVISRTDKSTGLTVTGVIAQDELFGEVNLLRRSQILVVVCFLCVSFVVTSLLFRHYYRRVHRLVETMQASDLNRIAPVTSKDEIGLISAAYNEMCVQMQGWIDRHYNALVQLRTAELRAMTAQINPHFIYNTLESIRMRALINGDEDVSRMLLLFGSMFRWAMRLDENIVLLEDELAYINAYLQLQCIRFPEKLACETETDKAAPDCAVPKLILQPIVENAITHGCVEQTGGIMHIWINAACAGDSLVIEVRDDGAGMSAQRLSELRAKLDEPAHETAANKGIGLKNVHDRLRLLFGSEYGVELESEANAGTVVRIRVPIMTTEEMTSLV